MITDIRHIGFVASSLENAVKFYVGVLGFTLFNTGRLNLHESKVVLNLDDSLTYYKFRLNKSSYTPEVILEAYVLDRNKKVSSTLNHVSLTVRNIEVLFSMMEELKLTISTGIIQLSGHKLFFGKDYDGNRIEFVEKIINDK